MPIEEIRQTAYQNIANEIQKASPAERAAAEEQLQQSKLQGIAAESEQKEGISREDLQSAVDTLNDSVSLLNHRLKFNIDDDTGRLQVKVIDHQTGEIVREVPPERLLAFVKRFEEFMGLLFDEKA